MKFAILEIKPTLALMKVTDGSGLMYVRASGVAVAGSTTCSKRACPRVLIPFSEPRVEDSNSGFLIAYSWLLLGHFGRWWIEP